MFKKNLKILAAITIFISSIIFTNVSATKNSKTQSEKFESKIKNDIEQKKQAFNNTLSIINMLKTNMQKYINILSAFKEYTKNINFSVEIKNSEDSFKEFVDRYEKSLNDDLDFNIKIYNNENTYYLEKTNKIKEKIKEIKDYRNFKNIEEVKELSRNMLKSFNEYKEKIFFPAYNQYLKTLENSEIEEKFKDEITRIKNIKNETEKTYEQSYKEYYNFIKLFDSNEIYEEENENKKSQNQQIEKKTEKNIEEDKKSFEDALNELLKLKEETKGEIDILNFFKYYIKSYHKNAISDKYSENVYKECINFYRKYLFDNLHYYEDTLERDLNAIDNAKNFTTIEEVKKFSLKKFQEYEDYITGELYSKCNQYLKTIKEYLKQNLLLTAPQIQKKFEDEITRIKNLQKEETKEFETILKDLNYISNWLDGGNKDIKTKTQQNEEKLEKDIETKKQEFDEFYKKIPALKKEIEKYLEILEIFESYMESYGYPDTNKHSEYNFKNFIVKHKQGLNEKIEDINKKIYLPQTERLKNINDKKRQIKNIENFEKFENIDKIKELCWEKLLENSDYLHIYNEYLKTVEEYIEKASSFIDSKIKEKLKNELKRIKEIKKEEFKQHNELFFRYIEFNTWLNENK